MLPSILHSNHSQGYDLSAVFMRNWDTRDESGTDSGCEWKKDWQDVQKVCSLLDIPYQMVRCASSFQLPFSIQYRAERLTFPENTGHVSSILPFVLGKQVQPQTPISGVTSQCYRLPLRLEIWPMVAAVLIYREVKFGALLQKIIPQDTWLATGQLATLFIHNHNHVILTDNTRPLCTEIMDCNKYWYSPSASSPVGSYKRSNVLPLLHSRTKSRPIHIPPRAASEIRSSRTCIKMGPSHCGESRKHGYMLCW